jgi:hypothetical protein
MSDLTGVRLADERMSDHGLLDHSWCIHAHTMTEGCVDWQRVWDSALRYDYNTIDFGGDTYFFRNN